MASFLIFLVFLFFLFVFSCSSQHKFILFSLSLFLLYPAEMLLAHSSVVYLHDACRTHTSNQVKFSKQHKDEIEQFKEVEAHYVHRVHTTETSTTSSTATKHVEKS